MKALPAESNRAMSFRKYTVVTLAMCGLTLALYLACAFAFIQTSVFVTHSSNISQIISAYRFSHLKGIDADILFVGDSTAVVGVNPEIVEKITGLSSYNVSLTVGSFIAVGNILVDNYLKQNRPPRVIVLYIGPWTTPNRPEDMIHPDDTEFRLQYPSWEATFALINFAPRRQLVDYFLHYPRQLEALMRWSAGQFWRGYDSGPAKQARITDAIETHRGWIPLATGVAGVPTYRGIPDGCRYPLWATEPDIDFIQSFRKRYETASTKVLVFISPIPDCDESLAYLRGVYAGLADRLPSPLPHRYFAYDTPRHNHLIEAGSDVNSAAIGAAINQILE